MTFDSYAVGRECGKQHLRSMLIENKQSDQTVHVLLPQRGMVSDRERSAVRPWLQRTYYE